MVYVYFIQKKKGGPIKIGSASDPVRRLGAIQGANPDPLCLLGVVLGGRGAEKRLHAHFAKHRLTGEWFKPVPQLRKFLDSVPSWEAVQGGAACPRISSRTDTYRALFQSGFPPQAIAAYYGVSRQAVHEAAYSEPRLERPRVDPPTLSIGEFMEANPDLFDDGIILGR